METPVRRSSIGGKETKRGTSPSSSTIKKSSPKPSSSSSTPTDENTTKSVPNYLKPTMSSSLDFSRIPAKKSTTDHGFAQKPAVDRRRSFERPPPSSQVSRAIRGPPSGTRDIKPQRSTSFSIKSTNTPSSAATAASTRPGSEKLYARTSSLKDRKVVGPQMSKSYSLKRTAKKEPTSLTSSSSSSAAKKPPRSVTSESSVDYESRSSVDHLIIEDDFVNIDDSEVQSLPEMSEMPESSRELADPTNYVEVEEEESPKESTVIVGEEEEDHHHQPCHEHVMEEEEKQSEEKTDHETVQREPAVILDDQKKKVELIAEEQNLVGNEQDESDIKVVEVVPTETMVEETIMEEETEEEQDNREPETEKEEDKPEEVDEKMVEEVKDEKMVEEVKEEKKVEETVCSPPADSASAATGKTQGSVAGKKDKQAYNDVIEETATKLMGNKSKNKVLALAGAFETVISLQDTKKS